LVLLVVLGPVCVAVLDTPPRCQGGGEVNVLIVVAFACLVVVAGACYCSWQITCGVVTQAATAREAAEQSA